MRLGLLTDIHEDVEHLRRSLAALKAEGVDRLVFLGDACQLSERLEETVALLAEAGAVGVWGNHDFGLCHKPDEELSAHYSPSLIRYMRGLAPRLEVEGCLFTHVEPWLDGTSLEDLWWFDGLPDTPARVAKSLAAVPNRVLFVGHFHRWFVAGRNGPLPWHGEGPITLDPAERFLVGIAAVCEGRCAVFETEGGTLTPLDVRSVR